jgi:BirA family biotin operon repressor/biotin-[acetyl-CoA-carboxylase] ligase
VVWFDSVDSTHSVAVRLIDQMDADGLTLRPTLLVASRQHRGLGRGRRQWISPAGGLYVSWIAAGFSHDLVAAVPMLAAAAAHSAIVETGARDVGIKWPNDVLASGRKLAGLLVHARRLETAVVAVGLGVNLRPVTLTENDAIHPPTSLDEILGTETSAALAAELAVDFVSGLVAYLDDPSTGLSRWRDHLVHQVGDPLSVRLAAGDTARGTFAGLTEEGFLRLQQKDDVRVIPSGDVLEPIE